jgi:hypothetical protein
VQGDATSQQVSRWEIRDAKRKTDSKRMMHLASVICKFLYLFYSGHLLQFLVNVGPYFLTVVPINDGLIFSRDSG